MLANLITGLTRIKVVKISRSGFPISIVTLSTRYHHILEHGGLVHYILFPIGSLVSLWQVSLVGINRISLVGYMAVKFSRRSIER